MAKFVQRTPSIHASPYNSREFGTPCTPLRYDVNDDNDCSFALVEEVGDSFILFGSEGLQSPLAVRAESEHRVSLCSSGAFSHTPSPQQIPTTPKIVNSFVAKEKDNRASKSCTCNPKSWSRFQVAQGLSMSMFIGMVLGALVLAMVGTILFADPTCDWHPINEKNDTVEVLMQQQIAEDVGLVELIAEKMKLYVPFAQYF